MIATQVALQYRWSHTGHIIKYTGTKGSYIDHVPTRYFLVQPPEKEVFAWCMDKHLFPRVFSCLRVEERRTLTMCSKAKLGSYGAWSESACLAAKLDELLVYKNSVIFIWGTKTSKAEHMPMSFLQIHNQHETGLVFKSQWLVKFAITPRRTRSSNNDLLHWN